REKIFVPRLQRQNFLVPPAVHLLIPARVRHLAWLPELQPTRGAAEKFKSSVAFDDRLSPWLAARRANTLHRCVRTRPFFCAGNCFRARHALCSHSRLSFWWLPLLSPF